MEVIGYGVNGTRLRAKNTTKDLKYQTLYVTAPGEAPVIAGGVDALAFWNLKPSGVDGTCVLIGFNSAEGPDVDLGPNQPGRSWHANLTTNCNNVNSAVPWSRFALSDDGSTAVAWTQDDTGDITVYAFEGQTGASRWKKTIPCGTPDQCQYYLSYGADISSDGRWVVYDDGVEGAGPHQLHVLAAADGAPRAAPVQSPDAVPAHASPNGDFMFSSDDASAPSTGAFSTWLWDAASGVYKLVGSALPPLGSGGDGWTLAQYAFSVDDDNKTWLAVVWFDTSLAGPSVLALYDAAAPASGPVSWAATTPLAIDVANAAAVVDCAGGLCAAGFYTQKVGGPQPTLVVVAAAAPGAVWNFTTPGSVDAVSVTRSGASGSFYVLAVGCASASVCTQPGGDLYGFEVTVAA